MRNIVWLYDNDGRFREAVQQAAADWLGSTSLNFAGAWLMEQHKYEHHDSDYEDLIGQHLNGPWCVVPDTQPSERIAELEEQIGNFEAEMANLENVAEKYRADSIAAQADADAWRAKCGALLDAAHEMIRIGGDV